MTNSDKPPTSTSTHAHTQQKLRRQIAFALSIGRIVAYPLQSIFSILFNFESIDESRFHCSKKSNICLKKKFVQRGSPEKKIPAQAVSEKKKFVQANFIEYLQSYQILIYIYYNFYFIIFIIIQYTVYVVGTLAAI